MVDFNLSEDEQAIQELARKFALQEIRPKAAHYDETMEYPWEVIAKAHEAGLLNLAMTEKAGGMGLSHFSQILVAEELAYGCTGIATAIAANDLALGPLCEFAPQDVLDELCGPMLESSDRPKMAAYCVTEPGAGSDVQSIRTTVKKDGDDYIMNGEKMWITNGSTASWYYVLATTDPSQGHKTMCAFAVPANLKGVEPQKKEINCGQRCSDTRGIVFKDVRIPKRYMLGQEGDGFKIAMRAFDISRPMVAIAAIGLARSAFEHARQYSLERKTFGKVIAKHQAVAFMLADMAKDIEAGRLLAWKAAKQLDEGKRNTMLASMAKCFGGDAAVRIASDAVQIYGGYGYNTEYPVEKLYRDAKIYQIYEGTQQIQRMIIARHVLEEA